MQSSDFKCSTSKSQNQSSVLILNWRCPKNPQAGGAEKVTLKHASYWVKKRFNALWLAGKFKGAKSEEIIDGVKIIRFGNPLIIYFLAPLIYWFKFKGNFNFVVDEIHGLPFLTPLWAFKSKKIAFIHEVAQEIWDEMFPFPLNLLGRLYEKIYFLFYKNTPFITVSNSTKTDLIKHGIQKKNIHLIPNGLDLKPVEKIPQKEKKLTLLFVGRLVKMKGVEESIKIFYQVKKKLNNSQLKIVGYGKKEYIIAIQRLCRKLNILNNVLFYGPIEEQKKISLLRSSHFLIHTSVREGFGLTVIEANSQGTPVIAYNSPGLKDIVEDGINGYKIKALKKDKKRREQGAKKILAVFKNKEKYKKLVSSSIEYSKKFKWSKATAQSFQLLNKLSLVQKSDRL